jgi:hypothetical protein
MRAFVVLAALGIGLSVSGPAKAAESVPVGVAAHLDKAPAEFTWSAAAERRHMIMRETMRQQRYGRGPGYGRGHAYGRGYGYGPRPGYGPPRYYNSRPYRGW